MGSIRDRLAANSRAYQKGNPVTSTLGIGVSGIAAVLFVAFAVRMFTVGEAGAGLLCLAIGLVATLAVYLNMLGKKKSETP